MGVVVGGSGGGVSSDSGGDGAMAVTIGGGLTGFATRGELSLIVGNGASLGLTITVGI